MTTAGLGQLDHLGERRARRIDREALRDLVLGGEVVVHAIRAEQQAIAAAQRDVRHLDANVGRDADGVDEDGAERGDLCLLDRELALDHEDLGDRVVGRDL